MREQLAGTCKSHLTIEEVAKMTGRAPYTVRAWVKAGRIKAERITGTGPKRAVLVRREEVTKLIASGRGTKIPTAVVQ